MTDNSKRPEKGGVTSQATGRGTSNRDWWPNQLNLKVLHQNCPLSNPMGREFIYAREFKKLDLAAVKGGSEGNNDHLAGLVAIGLRPLRALVHPHGMAQCRHLPHH